ncbi:MULTISPECIES: iron-sulfur-binding ferredoxin reductase [unclassified Pseudomonas]|uniref:iron-sulfur-binding ferredoxin reductase n=1 Tax=unclassified Pseudomonas TaxID=196821 RepID=UPI002ACB160D|nr:MULTISPECIES: iron-sulfur-binding ferredoxin reductase [unclassified Pseudomonas]MEB0039009.1 iron-sulfur-binding ferredoxin reductase [Pseudomonas sp. MH10]MEB0091117.1 iron-sulfur-binding ferredoxin reductase [Pseudomonas sp. CCI4.2]MEB0120043.1 iron-sulfur-binding ferredoxin reductase [Pseudomonas sp. CCI1.2]WPX56013.1 iron-sulfur-binding ferredoxin reductase [Pseudomonas sp. CCI4.2]WPX63454.1 iron-sulfur-binding ferredoxin reductase [Pseudomonas sp. MH10]
MPELSVGDRTWSVASASNLLDALNSSGITVPYSCRAGSCHACLVRCLSGEPADAMPEALEAGKRQQGWRLACQCSVVENLTVEVFDPLRDGLPAKVDQCEWLSPTVLRLRLIPERPLRYRAGQHLVLWATNGVARPYSLASLPEEDRFLEFHLDCRQPGAFSDAARQLQAGDSMRLGELRGGALQYDPDWQPRPLWLLAAGTGLGPLWGVLREALRQEHQGAIRVMHVAHDASEHYMAGPLAELAAVHSQVQVELITAAEFPAALAALRVVSRQTMALLCGGPAGVEQFAKRLYMAGLPRNQLLADVFLSRA